MTILGSCDKPKVKYHSSISQHKNTLCVMKKNEWCPLAFDAIDYIDCGHIESHRAAVTDGDDIGFHFDVKNCRVLANNLVYHDQNQVVLKALPEWFGPGFYEEVENGQAFINADNGALGESNLLTLRTGLSYAISDTILPPVA